MSHTPTPRTQLALWFMWLRAFDNVAFFSSNYLCCGKLTHLKRILLCFQVKHRYVNRKKIAFGLCISNVWLSHKMYHQLTNAIQEIPSSKWKWKKKSLLADHVQSGRSIVSTWQVCARYILNSWLATKICYCCCCCYCWCHDCKKKYWESTSKKKPPAQVFFPWNNAKTGKIARIHLLLADFIQHKNCIPFNWKLE